VGVQVSDFHFELPEELIAQEALADRAGSRLLHVRSGELSDRKFREFPELLRADDLLVFNNTRVFPARLFGRRNGRLSGEDQSPHVSQSPRGVGHAQHRLNQNPEVAPGRIEVLLTRQISVAPNEWECLVRPGRKIGVGERLVFGERGELQAEVISRGEFGERRIRFLGLPALAVKSAARMGPPAQEVFALPDSRRRLPLHKSDPAAADGFFELVEKIGHVPLPPYISRADSAADRERYQTVYARERGSVAAPTAGLHFTAEILERMRERGIETAEVTLHVGLGTFQPVRVEKVEEHRLHSEAYSISEEAAEKINGARREGRRIIAVGTTTVRTLEYAAELAARQGAGGIRAGAGEANIFIYPGYKFRVVGALLTNFHLPESTLLMLVCALGGTENVMQAYAHAVKEKYRFYSYGDCMFLE
jgi:S-adenosylmethionine:tRNA ribosyltransferase-isomerase